ncbi:UNKNOWN [Stylonychia lemnae]|uniref:Uncharacterized protein n=1 Tax=Stylonychia lemnae TaxID=5949 RepID=A0A078AP12_STYLE|nr:UNKNOWN [Stylonychia lemnae]|eukprot:CDW82703.1 UNKNOWN [Stylonychia lemnae]
MTFGAVLNTSFMIIFFTSIEIRKSKEQELGLFQWIRLCDDFTCIGIQWVRIRYISAQSGTYIAQCANREDQGSYKNSWLHITLLFEKPVVQLQHDHHFVKEDKNQIDLNEGEKEKVEEVKRETDNNKQKGEGKDNQEQFKLSMLVMTEGQQSCGIINLVINLIMRAVTITFIEVYKYGALLFVMCFFWGFRDNAINTHSYEILGIEYKNNSDPSSFYNILHFTIMVTGLGYIFCGMPFFFDFYKKLDTETVDNNFETRPRQR